MKKTVISFTHTNYCIRSAGTEKFVRKLSNILQKQGYSHLNFFSFYDDDNRMKTQLVGMNFNDKFVGIYTYSKIAEVLENFIFKNNLEIYAIHFQHLLHHNLDIIQELVCWLRVPVYYIMHDYYLLCPQLKLIDSQNNFCGVTAPCKEKCKQCNYSGAAMVHFEKINSFINSMQEYMEGIVTPSDYVTSRVKLVFPRFKNKVITRPHLKPAGHAAYRPVKDSKLKIAFAGGQFAEKGYHAWEKIVQELLAKKPDAYAFFYLGSGKKVIPNVENIYVSTAEQGEDAMVAKLKEHNIQIAFVWPGWAETYSYVYYELAESGAYVVSNKSSGNICAEIEANKNGKLFNTLAECACWLCDDDAVKKEVNRYRESGAYHPETFTDNEDLSALLKPGNTYTAKAKNNAHALQVMYTLAYRVKYRHFI